MTTKINNKVTHISILKTPRKENGNLNDKCCDICGSSTGALALFTTTKDASSLYACTNNSKNWYCKSCLLKTIDLINKKILEI